MKRFLGLVLAALLLLGLTVQADVIESTMILVNKEYGLPSNYEPSDLVRPDVAYAPGVVENRKQMRADAAHALEELFAAAQTEGIELLAISGYRSYWTQKEIYDRRLRETSESYVSIYVAQPGHSEHQTGLAMDLGIEGYTDLTERFADTDAYAWLNEHAHEYGFIIRYPKDGTEETGYAFEPWHIRYLGDRAAEVFESGLTLEAWYAKEREGASLSHKVTFKLPSLFN